MIAFNATILGYVLKRGRNRVFRNKCIVFPFCCYLRYQDKPISLFAGVEKSGFRPNAAANGH